MLGGEPVVDGQHGMAALDRQCARSRVVKIQIAHDPAAAVEVNEEPQPVGAVRPVEASRHSSGIHVSRISWKLDSRGLHVGQADVACLRRRDFGTLGGQPSAAIASRTACACGWSFMVSLSDPSVAARAATLTTSAVQR